MAASTPTMRRIPSDVRTTAVLLFLGLTACYLALSPGAIRGQGYTFEEIDSGSSFLGAVEAWASGAPVPKPVLSRHGPLPVLFDLPFIAIGRKFASPDFWVSMQPILLTAAMVAVLFLWLRKLTSPAMSLLLALAAAFGTMLWPYAYIGLETKQSFFLFLAGYLGLSGGPITRWPRLVMFAVSCGLAIGLKSNGALIAPAVAFLVLTQFRRDWHTRIGKAFTVLAVVAALGLAGAWGRGLYWAPRGGSLKPLVGLLISSPFELFINAVGIWGSPMKGLFIFAPLLIAGLIAVPKAFRTDRDTTIFALTITGATMAFLCFLKSPADEVWGSRYMHVVIAPTVLCIGAGWSRGQFRHYFAIAVLALVGAPIAFLGSFYHYGNVTEATRATGQNTLEWITGDRVWSGVTFNARTFGVWLEGGTTPVPWTPKHVWVWTPPPGERPPTTIDLRDYSTPQSFLARTWRSPVAGSSLVILRLLQLALLLGPLLLLGVFLRTLKESRALSSGRRPPESTSPGDRR